MADLISTKKITFDQAVIKFSDDPSKNNGGMMINPATGNTQFELNDLDPKVFFVIDKLKGGRYHPVAVKWEDRGKEYTGSIILRQGPSLIKPTLMMIMHDPGMGSE